MIAKFTFGHDAHNHTILYDIEDALFGDKYSHLPPVDERDIKIKVVATLQLEHNSVQALLANIPCPFIDSFGRSQERARRLVDALYELESTWLGRTKN